MLKSIRLKNFKLHADTSIEAAPITVFIGPNNSGKSSIFQALLCLRQAALRQSRQFLQKFERQQTSYDQPFSFREGELVEVGDFNDVVRQDQAEIHVIITGTVQPPKVLQAQEELSVDLNIKIRNNVLSDYAGFVQTSQGRCDWEAPDGTRGKSATLPLPKDGVTLNFGTSGDFRFIQFAGHNAPPQNSEANSRFTEVGNHIGNAPLSLLNSLHPVYSLRGLEQWGYPLTSGPPGNIERVDLSDRAIALANTLAYNRKLEEKVSKRLEELLEIAIKVQLVPSRRVTIWAAPTANKRPDTLYSNEGMGASQLPFILVPVGLTPPGESILLSEPEAHLHPKGQCELMRMLLTVARKENIQFFIETHSEHVLHVILNAIGKGEWEPSQVAIYSFVNDNGTAKATRLEVDDQGGVKGGLPGFFDQSLDELTEYLETLKKSPA